MNKRMIRRRSRVRTIIIVRDSSCTTRSRLAIKYRPKTNKNID